MLNLDLFLCLILAGFLFASAGLALHPANKYSRNTKILKTAPRIILGFQFLIIPFLLDDITLTAPAGDLFTMSAQVRAIMWSLIVLFAAETVIQYLNVRYGRHESN